MSKKSTITINVQLNEANAPERIVWKSTDNPKGTDQQDAKSMFLSFFDAHTKETMKIDIWTPDFQIQEMDRMMFQTLRSLNDTYFKATKNGELAGAFQQFVRFFGEQTGIIPKETT